MEQGTRRLTEDEQADLVAHLSGEMPAMSAVDWEKRVADDPKARTEAHSLREVWNVLDLLPMPKPSSHLSERTLRIVAPDEVPSPSFSTKVLRWRNATALLWAAGFLLAVFAGYGLVANVPDQNRQFLDRLPVLTHFDELKAARDLEFLRALHRAKLLDKLDTAGDKNESTGTSP